MNQRAILLVAPLLLVLAVLWGCENDTSNDVAGDGGGGPGTTDKTCLGCHSSEDELKAALGVAKSGQDDVVIRVANKDDG